jgi:hypothetical protein
LALLLATYASSYTCPCSYNNGRSKSVLALIHLLAAVHQSTKLIIVAMFQSLQVDSILAKRGILNLHTVTLVLLKIILIKVLTVGTTFAGKACYQKMPVLLFTILLI